MNNATLPFAGPFDITSCRARMLDAGLPLILKISDCERYCGKGYGHYNLYNSLDAITTWVIPLLALSANMVFADSSLLRIPYGGKLFVVVRQYADPIGTISSLASKLALGKDIFKLVQCHLDFTALDIPPHEKALAIRDVGNVLYCMDDLGSEELAGRVDRVLKLLANHGRAIYPSIRNASRQLSLARVRNTLSSSMAIVVYVGAAFSALLKSNNSSQLSYAQPHTIALRVLCYFLLLQIILSAAAGGWSQEWTSQFIMARLGKRFHNHDPDFGWLDLGREQIQPWNGGIYSFRPQDSFFRGRRNARIPSISSAIERRRKHPFNVILAFLCISATFTIAFMMSWLTPTRGLGGRGVAEISYLVMWTTNFFMNEWMGYCVKDRKRLFHLIWAKDTVISLLVVLFFFLPFIGWYNSCKSWSAYFSRGLDGYIDLNLGKVETRQMWSVYFTGIIAGAAVQGIFALIIIGLNLDAYKLSRRSEKENREDLAQDEERLKPRTMSSKIKKDEEKVSASSIKIERVASTMKISTNS